MEQNVSFQAARLHLCRRRPYVARAAMALIPVIRPGHKSMSVDRWWRVYYDPAAVSQWPIAGTATVIYHEIWHLLRTHDKRAEAMQITAETFDIWNLAADLEEDDDIAAEGFSFPIKVYFPEMFGWPTNLLAEEYFNMLRDLPPDEGNGPEGNGEGGIITFCPRVPRDGQGQPQEATGQGNCGSAAHGQPMPWEEGAPSSLNDGIGEAEGDILRRMVAQEIRESSRTRGDIAAGFQRWADATLNPKVPWTKVLAGRVRHITSLVSGRVDYSYRRPSRRQHLSPKVVLPSMVRPVVKPAIIIDSSGSMGENHIAQALAETKGVLASLGYAEGVPVLSCDAAVHTAKRVVRASQVQVLGGGGTDMRVGIERALALRPQPNMIIVITDCYTPWPEEPPKIPVIVVAVADGESPDWATRIDVEI